MAYCSHGAFVLTNNSDMTDHEKIKAIERVTGTFEVINVRTIDDETFPVMLRVRCTQCGASEGAEIQKGWKID